MLPHRGVAGEDLLLVEGVELVVAGLVVGIGVADQLLQAGELLLALVDDLLDGGGLLPGFTGHRLGTLLETAIGALGGLLRRQGGGDGQRLAVRRGGIGGRDDAGEQILARQVGTVLGQLDIEALDLMPHHTGHLALVGDAVLQVPDLVLLMRDGTLVAGLVQLGDAGVLLPQHEAEARGDGDEGDQHGDQRGRDVRRGHGDGSWVRVGRGYLPAGRRKSWLSMSCSSLRMAMPSLLAWSR